MTQNNERMQLLKANGKKSARVTGDGRIFIGDVQVMPDHPIAENGISVVPTFHGRYNVLTVSFIVGAVNVESRVPGDTTMDSALRRSDVVQAGLEHLDPCICTVDACDETIHDYDCGREIARRQAAERERRTDAEVVNPLIDEVTAATTLLFDSKKYIGMKLEAAKKAIINDGLTPRVVNVNSQAQVVTRDRRADRVNLTVVGDIVQNCGIG